MKFLIVSSFHPLHLGGIETFVKNFLHVLKALGNAVDVLTCKLNGDDKSKLKDSLLFPQQNLNSHVIQEVGYYKHDKRRTRLFS